MTRDIGRGARLVTIGGSSMSPLLDVGDEVEVVRRAALRVGDVALIERGAELEPIVHRIWLITPGGKRSLVVHRGDHERGRFSLARRTRVTGVVTRIVPSESPVKSAYRALTARERVQALAYLARRLPALVARQLAGLGRAARGDQD